MFLAFKPARRTNVTGLACNQHEILDAWTKQRQAIQACLSVFLFLANTTGLFLWLRIQQYVSLILPVR